MASSNNANSNIRIPVSFPFPPPEPTTNNGNNTRPNDSRTDSQKRSRTSTNASASSTTSRIRTASLKLMEANPPPGMWAATGSVASRAPTLTEIRDRSFGEGGWHEETQRQKRVGSGEMGTQATESAQRPRVSPRGSSGFGTEPFPAVTEEDMNMVSSQEDAPVSHAQLDGNAESRGYEPVKEVPSAQDTTPLQPSQQQRQYSNGYVPPPKVPWTRATAIGLRAFSKWVLTPSGFLITLYSLNVVAWGGMLFLLLCNAAPAMCSQGFDGCNDIQSPRRIWIEIDSQILNALFCVTGFGLAPWRFRDLYWWAHWRFARSPVRKETAIRRLAGIHRGWFRLPGSDALPSTATSQTVDPNDAATPIPVDKMPDPPPTGIHSPPTKGWKMDAVLWLNAGNTFFQIVLCYYMWRYNRIDRPSWATGLFVALGCISAGMGGLVIYLEGKKVKKVEGVPAPKGYEDLEKKPLESENGIAMDERAPREEKAGNGAPEVVRT